MALCITSFNYSLVSQVVFSMAKMIHFVMSDWFLVVNVVMTNSNANAMNSNAKAMKSIVKLMKSIAKPTNSIANGTNSTAMATNSTANGTKSIAKVMNSIAKSCNTTEEVSYNLHLNNEVYVQTLSSYYILLSTNFNLRLTFSTDPLTYFKEIFLFLLASFRV